MDELAPDAHRGKHLSMRENRDSKIWYGEAVVRRQIVKITSGDACSTTAFPL